MRARQEELIEAVGTEVKKKLDEAIIWRRQSGIERIWREDDEYYHGVDDLNRDNSVFVKSASTEGGLTRSKPADSSRCTAFFNITRQFCDAASARMGDILLPAGDWNFSIKPTPVPESTDPQSPQQFSDTPAVQQTVDKQKEEIQKRCDLGEKRIHDWLVQCQYHAEVRKCIENSARIGTGILKGPVPKRITLRRTVAGNNGEMSLVIDKDTVPVSHSVDPWDFFPDPACGDNIHNGSYVFERDRMSARQLRDLKEINGYLADKIDQVIDEGPGKKNYTDGMRTPGESTTDDDRFEVWYFYGLIDVEKLEAMQVNTAEVTKRDMVPACVTLVNDTPIKAFLNPLDSGEFPYDVMPWQQMSGLPWGIGVARQGRVPQETLNAAERNMMDNLGLTAGPQLIIRPKAITPADGNWTLTSRKVWLASEEADMKSVADAIMAINIPTQQEQLMNAVKLAKQDMEDCTGIRFIMQGEQGSAPDTVGGMQLLNQNASTILRRLARTFDMLITEPHIRRYYEWLMMYGKEEEKGDWQIEAVGSTSLVDRDVQGVMAMQILNLSVNPAFGLDPDKAVDEVLKAARFIPDKFKMNETKKKQRQPVVAPVIQVAQIKAATDMKKIEADKWAAKVETTANLRRMEVDTDRDSVYNNIMANRDQANATSRREELIVKRELALLDYATKRGISLDKVKAELAMVSMKLKTQIRLTRDGRGPQVDEPLVEIPGRARDGYAYTE
ncbi:MAG: hypothetical protein WC373_09585 [Smithella sp.]